MENQSQISVDISSAQQEAKEDQTALCDLERYASQAFYEASLVMSIVCSIAIVLNLCIIIIFYKLRSHSSFSECLICNLAVADLLTGITALFKTLSFLAFRKYTENVQYCVAHIVVTYLACYMSLYAMCSISLERLWLIQYPAKYRAMRTALFKWIFILAPWILVFCLFALPMINHFSKKRDSLLKSNSSQLCITIEHEAHRLDWVIFQAINLLMPILLIIVVNFLIFRLHLNWLKSVHKRKSRNASASKQTKYPHWVQYKLLAASSWTENQEQSDVREKLTVKAAVPTSSGSGQTAVNKNGPYVTVSALDARPDYQLQSSKACSPLKRLEVEPTGKAAPIATQHNSGNDVSSSRSSQCRDFQNVCTEQSKESRASITKGNTENKQGNKDNIDNYYHENQCRPQSILNTDRPQTTQQNTSSVPPASSSTSVTSLIMCPKEDENQTVEYKNKKMTSVSESPSANINRIENEHNAKYKNKAMTAGNESSIVQRGKSTAGSETKHETLIGRYFSASGLTPSDREIASVALPLSSLCSFVVNTKLMYRKVKRPRTILLLMLTFTVLVTWLPYVIYKLADGICEFGGCHDSFLLNFAGHCSIIRPISIWTIYFQSTLNPIMYGFYNPKFRGQMAKLLHRYCNCLLLMKRQIKQSCQTLTASGSGGAPPFVYIVKSEVDQESEADPGSETGQESEAVKKDSVKSVEPESDRAAATTGVDSRTGIENHIEGVKSTISVTHSIIDVESRTGLTHPTKGAESRTSVMHPTEDVESRTSVMHPTKDVESRTSVMHPIKDVESRTSVMHPTEDVESRTSVMHPTEDVESRIDVAHSTEDVGTVPAKATSETEM